MLGQGDRMCPYTVTIRYRFPAVFHIIIIPIASIHILPLLLRLLLLWNPRQILATSSDLTPDGCSCQN